jgi:hypothetical protein
MLAFALLKGDALRKLLEESTQRLGDKPWGIGLLGFAPQALLDEQLAMAAEHKPAYAIIAGVAPTRLSRSRRPALPLSCTCPRPT